MATGKRFYWIKLGKEFMYGDVMDYIMTCKDGSKYVLLFQYMCLMAINNAGRLSANINGTEVPYDADRIQRETRFFSISVVRSGLAVLQKVGLIAVDESGIISIQNLSEWVGSETDYASQKRRQNVKSGVENFHTNLHTKSTQRQGNCAENLHTEIRDKSKEIRVKSVENNTTWGNPISQEPNTVEEPTGEERPDFNTLEAYASGNIRNMTPYNREEMLTFRDDLPDDLIRHAIDEACATARSTPTWGYVRVILNRYVNSGFRTVADAKAAEEKFREGRNRYADRGRTAGGDDGPRRVFDGETIL